MSWSDFVLGVLFIAFGGVQLLYISHLQSPTRAKSSVGQADRRWTRLLGGAAFVLAGLLLVAASFT